MPDIASIGPGAVGPIDRPGAIAPGRTIEPKVREQIPSRPGDRVELSTHAQFLDQMRHMPEVRTDRVTEIRAALADGSYDVDSRLNTAIERLISDVTE